MATTPTATAATIPFSIPTTLGADPWKVTKALVWGLLPELDTVELLALLALGAAEAVVPAAAAVVGSAAGAGSEAEVAAAGAGAAEEADPLGFKTESTEGT